MLGNDITTPVAITEFEKAGFTQVFDKDKISIVLDHSTPCKDIKSAELCKQAREFAHKHNITNFFDVGHMGVEHALLPEKGLAAPGEVIVGADSHTCTYGALGAFSTGIGSTDMAAGMATGLLWFKVPSAIKVTLKGKLQPCVSGKDVILHLIGEIGVDGAPVSVPGVRRGRACPPLSMDDRFTIANMAIEAGGKNGIFPRGREDHGVHQRPGEPPLRGLCGRSRCGLHTGGSHRPGQAGAHRGHAPPAGEHPGGQPGGRPAHRPGGDRLLHQWAHPGPAGGRCYSEGRKKVAENVRCIVIPGTQEIVLQAMKEGLLEIFIASGCAVSAPTCGPCLGGTHGRHGGGGALRLHHEPELCGPYGPCAVGSHPGLSRRGRRLCSGRLRGRPRI